MGKKLLTHSGGFKREDKSDRIDFTLIPTQELTRLALHYTKGAKVHGRDNWKKSQNLITFKQSAYRHFIAWQNGDTDEDHASALIWNVFSYEHLKNEKSNNVNIEI